MLGMLLTFGIIAFIVSIAILASRGPGNSSAHREIIRGHPCPYCHSDKVQWAGYADRKECRKCGKIFT